VCGAVDLPLPRRTNFTGWMVNTALTMQPEVMCPDCWGLGDA